MDRNELLDLIPAYALEALDPEEKIQVESLLKTDEEAQKLLAEYQVIANDLVLATPARHAPTHLQADLRQRLAASRPLQPAMPPMKAEPTPVKVLPARRRPNIWLPLIAAAAAIAIIFGALTLIKRDPAHELYNQIVNTPGYHTMPIPSEDGTAPMGEMVASPDGKQAVIRMTRVPALSSDRTFELWLIDSSGAHSAGLFPFTQPDSTYYVIVPLDKAVGKYDAVGVSVEPEGGSPLPDGPSSAPIIVISTAL